MENTNQFMHLTPSEMLALWKKELRLEPVVRDCNIERSDGIDIDAMLTLHIQQWYAHLLTTAPVEWLPIEDVKAHVTLTADDNGVVTATVPAQYVRPIEWQLTAWLRPVTQFLTPDSHEAQVALDPFTQAGINRPAAIDHGNRLLLISVPAGTLPTLATARCVVRPTDGTFTFHHAALATIPHWQPTPPSLL